MALPVVTPHHKGDSHRLQPWNPTSGISGNWEEMGRTGICLQTKQDRRFPLLRNLYVPEMCRTKTCTWLFWQEKEGLDYPFPAHESGHLRRKCWRHICFSTNREAAKASPWSSLLRHSLRRGNCSCRMHTGCRALDLPFISVFAMWRWALNVLWLALFPQGPPAALKYPARPHLDSLKGWFGSGHLGNDRIKIA